MDVLSDFLSWQFIVFSLVLAGIVETVRRFVEYFEKDVKDLDLWNKLILPTMPVVLGALLGLLIKAYPYPSDFSSTWGRVFWGFVAGLVSTFLYRLVKAMWNSRIKASEKGAGCSEDDLRASITPKSDE